jgi:hypothetical protein
MAATEPQVHTVDSFQSLQLLTAEEVAKVLRVSPISVIRNFPSIRVGKRHLFRLSDVLAVVGEEKK